jgi:hypothetical protein
MGISTPQKGLNTPTSTQNATTENINSDMLPAVEQHFFIG